MGGAFESNKKKFVLLLLLSFDLQHAGAEALSGTVLVRAMMRVIVLRDEASVELLARSAVAGTPPPPTNHHQPPNLVACLHHEHDQQQRLEEGKQAHLRASK